MNLDDLQEELRKDITDFINTLKDDILKITNNSPTTIIGIKRPGLPNPFSSYLHGKLQQVARERPEYAALADTGFVMIDPVQEDINGLSPESISKRIIIGVEESYNASTLAYLQRLVESTEPKPLAVYYAVAKSPRLVAVYLT